MNTPDNYTIYGTYAGGPSEVIARDKPFHEARDIVRDTRMRFGWDAYMEVEEKEDSGE